MALLVSIKCLVYNHEPYLRQCLDGFVMQKTNFAFEAIVHDDASTDASAEIIREYAEKYPDIIKPIYETENQYSRKDGSLGRIMNAAIHPDAKYIAICEGDDYWTDPYKLQKQIDILEQDINIGLVYTKAKVYLHATGVFSSYSVGVPFENTEALILRNPVASLTTVYRKDIYLKYCNENIYKKSWLMGDFPLWIWFSLQSKIYYLDEFTAVYRVLENSASHFTSNEKAFAFNRSVLDIQLFFIENYVNSAKLKDMCLLNFYKSSRNLLYSLNDSRQYNLEARAFYKRKYYYIPFLLTIIYPLIKNKSFLFKAICKMENQYWKLFDKFFNKT